MFAFPEEIVSLAEGRKETGGGFIWVTEQPPGSALETQCIAVGYPPGMNCGRVASKGL